MKTYLIIPKTVIFAILVLAIYIVTAPLPIPSLLGIGEVRVILVAVLSRIGEEAFYYYIVKALTVGQIAEKPKAKQKDKLDI